MTEPGLSLNLKQRTKTKPRSDCVCQRGAEQRSDLETQRRETKKKKPTRLKGKKENESPGGGEARAADGGRDNEGGTKRAIIW